VAWGALDFAGMSGKKRAAAGTLLDCLVRGDFTMRGLAFSSFVALGLALAACAPKPADTKAPEGAAAAVSAAIAPDVALAAAKGDADPRIPTVDPRTITDTSPTGDVMHAFVIPGSETLFAAETEDAPKDDAGWARLQKATQDVIKGAEMLKGAPRSQGREGWIKAADMVIAATKTSATNLAKKSTDDLVFTDGDMMAGCTECHQKFRDLNPPKGQLIESPK
jgi:hypothetical protein